MQLPTSTSVAARFIKAADKMPNGPKFFLLALLLAAGTWCYTIDKAAAILHEAPPAIRALREQPVKPVAEIQLDSAKGQTNR